MINDFPRVLSLLRQEKKISQRKAATELGVSQALLSHYENGVREPGLNFVVRAADFYNVSCDYLLGRTMAKDGHSINTDTLPDASTEKGNVLRGSAMALLSKKLIVNSSALLLELLSKCDNRALVQNVTAYLSTAIYKSFRYIYMSDKSLPDTAFSIDSSSFSSLCDAEMKLCEHRLQRASAPDKNKVATNLPEMSSDALQRDYPTLAPSLFSVLHAVGEKIEKNY